jgi:1-deoxyxylulose-5-phosphate synthase
MNGRNRYHIFHRDPLLGLPPVWRDRLVLYAARLIFAAMTRVTAPDGSRPSPLTFGCMQFGGKADEAESRALYRACRERGINMFDTAHVYAEGRSEEILGGCLAGDRDGVIVATKVNFQRGNSAEAITASCHESLGRLRIEAIDLYYLHRFDEETPLEESAEALARLQDAGKIRSFGVSNFAAWQAMKAQAMAAQAGRRIDAIQPMLNLVKRQAEVEILPMSLDQGMDVFTYSPLGGGLLTGKYGAGAEGRLKESEKYARRYGEDWMHGTAENLTTLAGEIGADPATLAVAWTMRRPGVTAPIISARSVGQLLPSLAALDFACDAELLSRIMALTRRPPSATDRLEEA